MNSPPLAKRLFVACRPWSWPASVAPVLFGSVAAVVTGGVPPAFGRGALAVLAMVLLQSAANVLSDVEDFRLGLDRQVRPVSGAVVRGWLAPAAARRFGLLLAALGAAIGLFLAWRVSPAILALGAVGMASVLGYTALKRVALGDAAVFVNFGLLGAAGGWLVQAGRFSWRPAAWAVPFGFLIVAILHANNWRDRGDDRPRGFRTVAGGLGDRGSAVYYAGLLGGAYAWTAGCVLLPRVVPALGPPLPAGALAAFLTLPLALRLWRTARGRSADEAARAAFAVLDGGTAQLNLLFGLLATAGLVAQAILGGGPR